MMKRRLFLGSVLTTIAGSSMASISKATPPSENLEEANWFIQVRLRTHLGSYIIPVRWDETGINFLCHKRIDFKWGDESTWVNLNEQVNHAVLSYADLSDRFKTVLVDYNATALETREICAPCERSSGLRYLHRAHPQLGDYGQLIYYWEPTPV